VPWRDRACKGRRPTVRYHLTVTYAVGCHIITATNDILAKLALVGKDLHVDSLETVRMFREDAVRAGFTL
jgi:hypothetical protein